MCFTDMPVFVRETDAVAKVVGVITRAVSAHGLLALRRKTNYDNIPHLISRKDFHHLRAAEGNHHLCGIRLAVVRGCDVKYHFPEHVCVSISVAG